MLYTTLCSIKAEMLRVFICLHPELNTTKADLRAPYTTYLRLACVRGSGEELAYRHMPCHGYEGLHVL